MYVYTRYPCTSGRGWGAVSEDNPESVWVCGKHVYVYAARTRGGFVRGGWLAAPSGRSPYQRRKLRLDFLQRARELAVHVERDILRVPLLSASSSIPSPTERGWSVSYTPFLQRLILATRRRSRPSCPSATRDINSGDSDSVASSLAARTSSPLYEPSLSDVAATGVEFF